MATSPVLGSDLLLVNRTSGTPAVANTYTMTMAQVKEYIGETLSIDDISGGLVHTLEDLDDTAIVTPANNQILVYKTKNDAGDADLGTPVWKNYDNELNLLKDVAVTGVRVGDILQYDGTSSAFVNSPLDQQIQNIIELGNIDIPATVLPPAEYWAATDTYDPSRS